jgi:hypothetical protein
MLYGNNNAAALSGCETFGVTLEACAQATESIGAGTPNVRPLALPVCL